MKTTVHVLLVEDEALILEMLASEFEGAGATTSRAMSADAALGMLEGGATFSAVVTDVRMPGKIDGLGLFHWLREQRPDMPVFIVTGFADDDLQRLAGPCVAVFRKPYRPAELVAAVLRRS